MLLMSMKKQYDDRCLHIRDQFAIVDDEMQACYFNCELEDLLPSVTQHDVYEDMLRFYMFTKDWDGYPHTFDINIPVELFESYTDEEIRKWFASYVINAQSKEKLQNFINDLRSLYHTIDRVIEYLPHDLRDIDVISSMTREEWDDAVEQVIGSVQGKF